MLMFILNYFVIVSVLNLPYPRLRIMISAFSVVSVPCRQRGLRFTNELIPTLRNNENECNHKKKEKESSMKEILIVCVLLFHDDFGV